MHRFGPAISQMNAVPGFAYLNGTDPFLTPSGCQITILPIGRAQLARFAMDYSFAILGSWPEPG